jgi:hypothetical protein
MALSRTGWSISEKEAARATGTGRAGTTPTIIRCADEEQCGQIVLAESGPSAIREWLMRTSGAVVNSVASVVIHLARVLVLIAK